MSEPENGKDGGEVELLKIADAITEATATFIKTKHNGKYKFSIVVFDGKYAAVMGNTSKNEGIYQLRKILNSIEENEKEELSVH